MKPGEIHEKRGRRVFFHPNGPGCYKCHTVDGRGGRVGPDLSGIGRSMSREKLIDSILEPSREVAPQFTTWSMIDKDGVVHTGMIVHENEGRTILGDAEGKTVELPTIDIEQRMPQRTSVMPEKLQDRMTLQEFRDLLAFLQSLGV
jgi:putative heme-binding domain-containing protein